LSEFNQGAQEVRKGRMMKAKLIFGPRGQWAVAQPTPHVGKRRPRDRNKCSQKIF